MKKLILVCAVLSLTVATASAQLIRLGAKAGLTMLSTDVKASEPLMDVSNPYDEFKSKDIGWNAGLMARINLPLTTMYIQPELLYNHAGYEVIDHSGTPEKVHYGSLELPVLLGFKLLFLNAHVGPTFTLADINGGDVYKIETPDVGFQAGLGLTLRKVTLDLRYQGYFAKKWDDIDLRDVTQKLRANDGYWGISLGYFF